MSGVRLFQNEIAQDHDRLTQEIKKLMIRTEWTSGRVVGDIVKRGDGRRARPCWIYDCCCDWDGNLERSEHKNGGMRCVFYGFRGAFYEVIIAFQAKIYGCLDQSHISGSGEHRCPIVQ